MGGGYKGMEAWNDNLIVLCSSFYSYELPSAFILVCTTVTTLLQSRLIRKVQWDVNIDCIVFHYGDVSKIKFPNHIDIIDNKKKTWAPSKCIIKDHKGVHRVPIHLLIVRINTDWINIYIAVCWDIWDRYNFHLIVIYDKIFCFKY